MVERLYLHVGHGKTGTSFIQSSLALSVASLYDQGIYYPISSSASEKAKMGKVTSGNFLSNVGEMLSLAETVSAEKGSLLLSSEILFKTLFHTTLTEAREHFPKASIKIILFVRNPISNAASSYQEFVKQGKTKLTFSQFLQRFNKPSEVEAFIRECYRSEVSVSVFNYSDRKSDLLEIITDWLEVEAGSLSQPPVSTVNRSLSMSEMLLLQKLTKAVGGDKFRLLGRRLCDLAPNIPSDQPRATQSALDNFRKRMDTQVKSLHEFLGFEIYGQEDLEDYLEDGKKKNVHFSEHQLDIIVRSIKEKVAD